METTLPQFKDEARPSTCGMDYLFATGFFITKKTIESICIFNLALLINMFANMITTILIVSIAILIYWSTNKKKKLRSSTEKSQEDNIFDNNFPKNNDITLPEAPNSNSSTNLPSEKSEEIINVTTEEGKNSVTFIVSLNEEEFIKRVKNGTISKGANNHKKNIDNIVGFYGVKVNSPNKEYCVVFRDGGINNDTWENGKLSLVQSQQKLFKKSLQRPHDCHVSNNGVVICCDWLKSEGLIGKFLVFDVNGELLFSKKTTANLGNCGISDDGIIALFETYSSETKDSNKLFIIDVPSKKEISIIERPFSFNTVRIDSISQRIKLIDHRNFVFEIDFDGNQTNLEEYDQQIMIKGSVYDRLQLYCAKPVDVRFGDKSYLIVLQASLKDKDTLHSFGKDKLYRMIGEYYYANGDIFATIENWEKAIEINPAVGVKKKLDDLKKQNKG